jgi:2-polyprenyl-3-methyl-5-hydroxy-6-metoxy-1,4-benzoquinol methylase
LNCPTCHSKDYKVLYNVLKPQIHSKTGLPGIVKKCNKCGLIFKSFEKAIEVIYDDEYATSFLENDEYYGIEAINFFHKIIKETFSRLKKNEPKLLDVGSGVGIMLQAAKKVGFDPTGVELSEKLAKKIQEKGYKIINKDVTDIPPGESYDAITMMDLIEHLEDPSSVLLTLKGLIGSEGELIVYTPNHNSLIVKIAHIFYKLGIKSPMENIFACTHTCFFTTKTLSDIIQKTGYEITDIKHFHYDTNRPGQKVSLISKIAINIIEQVGSIIGLKGFRVAIYAKKPTDGKTQ